MNDAQKIIVELRQQLRSSIDALPPDDLQGRFIGSIKLNAMQEIFDKLHAVPTLASEVTSITMKKA